MPYDGKVGVYSLGVIAYAMLTGRVPFETKTGGFLGVAIKMVTVKQPDYATMLGAKVAVCGCLSSTEIR